MLSIPMPNHPLVCPKSCRLSLPFSGGHKMHHKRSRVLKPKGIIWHCGVCQGLSWLREAGEAAASDVVDEGHATSSAVMGFSE